MLGGTSDPKALELSGLEIRDIIETELNTLFGLRKPLEAIEITRWKEAIPVYSSQVRDARVALEHGLCKIPGLMVFTNYSKEVSIRGMILSLKDF
jgi:protoporphyrinogen oxidase